MDSPVMLDTASKFGRGIDLDCDFPGFNFDEEGFGRRGDFRSHLDDLASRHPEFADHLLGSTWGDIPFPGLHRNRRRDSESGNNFQNYQDEDVKSQASGSSAASGASAVSSHGDPEITRHDYQEPKRNRIPQYGLRNTVDIGQHQTNMDNPQKINRNQRSMSAPPENRQESQQQNEQPRFVSRVEITPQKQQPQPEQIQREKSPEPQTQQQKAQQQGNVRHIPIFVEGRDEPVISRNRGEAPFPGNSSPPQFQPSPPQFQPPPQYQAPPVFHRPSHYNERFGRQNWPSQFTETFFDSPKWGRDEPDRRFTKEPFQNPQYQQKQQPQYQPNHSQHQKHPHQQQHSQHPQQQSEYQQNPPQHQQPPQQQKQEPEAPKPKQIVPKDPLERVALVQNEVDSLNEQVKNFKGTSRQEKDYMYLDEMLTRELIKLDDIETEGKENVRLARKAAIKAIQESINLLESKVPLPGQQEEQPQEAEIVDPQTETEQPPEALDDKPIPLPPGPNSQITPNDSSEEKSQVNENTASNTENPETPADVSKLETPVETEKTEPIDAQEPSQNQISEAEINLTMDVQQPEVQAQEAAPQELQETPKVTKSPKKVKKTKKPVPVSAEAIPLPGPQSSDNDAK